MARVINKDMWLSISEKGATHVDFDNFKGVAECYTRRTVEFPVCHTSGNFANHHMSI